MTPHTGSLELAHARIAARWGARAGEGLWQRLQTTRPLAAVMDLARSSTLSGWLGSLDAAADPHRIDQQFRRHWRDRVDEVARWMPTAWQPALRWCASGVDLPVWQRWAEGGALPGWVAQDPVLAPLTEPDRTPAGAAVRRFAAAARAEPRWLWSHWVSSWRELLPALYGRRAVTDTLEPLLQQHLRSFAAPEAVDGWGMRRELETRLMRLWRRHPAEPLGAFVHLALVALEGERLRGELVRRAAFPDRTLTT